MDRKLITGANLPDELIVALFGALLNLIEQIYPTLKISYDQEEVFGQDSTQIEFTVTAEVKTLAEADRVLEKSHIYLAFAERNLMPFANKQLKFFIESDLLPQEYEDPEEYRSDFSLENERYLYINFHIKTLTVLPPSFQINNRQVVFKFIFQISKK